MDSSVTRQTSGPPAIGEEGADQLRLDDQLCFALYAATNEIVRVYRPLLAELGLTYPQYLLLMVLWEDDNLTVSEVAARLHLSVQGLLPIIARLHHSALLERRRDATDSRVIRLTLTVSGRKLEGQVAAVQQVVVHQTHLPSSALVGLRRQLCDLADDLRSLDKVSAP